MSQRGISRRAVVGTLGALAVGPLAGCLGDDDVTLTIHDQSGDGETVLVKEASAPTEFHLDVHYRDEESRTDTFEGGTTQEDVEIELDPPLEEDQEVTVGVHDEEDGESLVSEDIQYEVE